MKKTMMLKSKPSIFLTLFCALTLIMSLSQTAIAQVTLNWPPTAATIVDLHQQTTDIPESINTDMYTNYNSGSAGGSMQAVVWHENAGGTYTTYLIVYDNVTGATIPTSGTPFTVANDAKNPDVVILDDGNGSGANLSIGIVYEDVSSSPTVIRYTEVDAGSMFTTSASLTATTVTAVLHVAVSNTSYDAEIPHIDAFVTPDLSGRTDYLGSTTNPYEEYMGFIITWTEYNTSTSANEVYVMDGAAHSGGGPSGTATFIATGERSDVAAQHEIDAGSTNDFAYICYVDGGTGNLDVQYYDITGAGTVGAPVTLENTYTILNLPRIDAMNVKAIGGTTIVDWMAIAEVDISGNSKIRSYEPGVTINQHELSLPFSYTPASLYEGWWPCVASGVGPDGYAPSSTTLYGNQHYIMGERVSARTDMIAFDRDLSATWGGYDIINNNTLNDGPGSTYRTALALGTSSNDGTGHCVAFENSDASNTYYEIRYKLQTGTSMAFKPTGLPSVVKENNLSAYPNPARDYVQVAGLSAEASYVVTDLAGRVVKTGTVSTAKSNIYVADLVNGLYIFNIKEGNQTHQLKFNKL